MPTLTDQVCLWCMPKTASAFLEHELREDHGGVPAVGQHAPARRWNELPPRLHVGTIRSPFTWYPSLWRHALGLGEISPQAAEIRQRLKLLTGEEQPSFPRFLQHATMLPASWSGGYILEAPEEHPSIQEQGLWSWTVRYMYFSGDILIPLRFIHVEHIAEDAAQIGVALRRPPRNTAAERAHRWAQPIVEAEWMQEMRESVSIADAVLMQTFGYASR